MKLSDREKRYLWYASLGSVIIIFLYRSSFIFSGSPSSFDSGLLAVAAALVFLPFVSEFSFMGFSIKQKLESTRKEIQQDIKELSFTLRSELHNLVNINSSQSVTVNTPPSDSLLDALTKEIKSSIAELNSEALDENEVIDPSELPDGTMLAFVGRYEIEKQLRRIWEDVFQKPVPRVGMIKLLNDLLRQESIPENIARSIRDASSVASPAIHGETPTKEQIEFLNDVLPPLISALESIETRD